MKKRLLVPLALVLLFQGGVTTFAAENSKPAPDAKAIRDNLLDNDPVAGMPGECQAVTGGWNWRQSATNYNQDCRYASAFDSQYRFSYNNLNWGGQSAIYQYVSDPIATGYAYYTMYDFGSWNGASVGLYQEIAPTGWNLLTNYSSSSFQPQILEHAYDNQGRNVVADAVKVPTVVRKESMIKMDKADQVDSKDVLTNKMVNSRKNIKNVKGSFTEQDNTSQTSEKISFEVVGGEKTQIQSEATNGSGLIQEKDGNKVTSYRVDAKGKKTRLNEMTIAPVTEDKNATRNFADTYYLNDSNERVFNGGEDIYQLGQARQMLEPTNMAAIFLNDFSTWSIDGNGSFLGRETTKVSGKISTEYQEKYKSDNFTMEVDKHTGVLLKVEMKNSEGKVMKSKIMDELTFTVN